MTSVRNVLAALALALIASSGCRRPLSVDRVASPAAQDLVALLPDSGSGAVGLATASNAMGVVELREPRAATRLSPGQAPSAVVILSEGDVQRVFGAALAALPPAPQTFTLYFQFESLNLTTESRALLTDTIRAVRLRPVPDVIVVGHTDRTGSRATNFELALRRANAVRAQLVAAGLDERAVAVVSHGEEQPLVPTLDGAYEPRNRRVDIRVR